MLIIGLHNGVESGACLIADGELVEAVSEERFSRVKNHKGPPELSLTHILAARGLPPTAIDRAVYALHGGPYDRDRYQRKLIARVVEWARHDAASADAVRRRLISELDDHAVMLDGFRRWYAGAPLATVPVDYCDHHHAHAWSAFACSPFDEAMVFTMDGRGNFKSGSVSHASTAQGVVEVDFHTTLDSLGFLYGQVTELLGFTPHRHEGKITGLAAFGDPAPALDLFERMIGFVDGELRALPGLYVPFNGNFEPAFRAAFAGLAREDVAAAVQRHTERTALAFVEHHLRHSNPRGLRQICLAGGLFANVRVNQVIAESGLVDNVFIFPHMGDGGITVGGACQAWFAASGKAKVALPTVHLGPGYGEAEIAATLAGYGGRLRAARPGDKVAGVIEDLRAGRVVGYFDGRMEFGPRALGARSILVHGRDRAMNDWLNRRLRRTEFMPFAPVSPVERAGEAYLGWRPDHVAARFMTRTYACTEAFKAGHAAVVHVDGTARPQIVDATRNGDYHAVVSGYCRATGEMALVNTSFNAHEEPIVCLPKDAIDSLLQDCCDVLWIGGHRVERA